MAGGQRNIRTKWWSWKKPMLEPHHSLRHLDFKVRYHSCFSRCTIPCFWHQLEDTWAETEPLEMTQIEKVCLEMLSFFEKQQVSPFPHRNQFCSNREKNFFFPEFKFHAHSISLKRHLFLGAFERYFKLAGDSHEAVEKAVSFSMLKWNYIFPSKTHIWRFLSMCRAYHYSAFGSKA